MMAFIDTIPQGPDLPAPVRTAEALMPATAQPASRIRRPAPRPLHRPRFTLSEPKPKTRSRTDVWRGRSLVATIVTLAMTAGGCAALVVEGLI